MKYNLLGDTGLPVSQFCLGTMTFGDYPEVRFTVEELKGLDEVSRLPVEYPGGILGYTKSDRLLA